MYSIQFAAALSLSVCPGAPKVNFSIGRPAPLGPAPEFVIPLPTNTTDELIASFGAIGFSSDELVALLAAHTAGGANDFSPPVVGYAFTIY